MQHAARDFARGIRAFLRLSLPHVTKSIPLALILKSERGTHFAGPLVQPVDFQIFQLPLLFLSSPLLSLSSPNLQRSQKMEGQRLTQNSGFKQGSQFCCLGRFGGEKRGTY